MISIEEASKKLNISKRRLQKLCDEGRIDGVKKISNVWILPDNFSKPTDARIIDNKLKDNEYSLKDLCKELGISLATGKNWIKLKKIKPMKKNGLSYFSKEYIESLKNTIKDNNNNILKSRRNKKYVSGSSLYKKYVSEDSKNLITANSILEYISSNNLIIDKDLINTIIYECAIQLILKKKGNKNTANSIPKILDEEKIIKDYKYLFKDLYDNKNKYLKIINNYKPLFDVEFYYEPNNDILGLIYISLTSMGERKNKGMYYTPSNIVNKLIKDLFNTKIKEKDLILDPCCGTGNFLLNMPNYISFNQLYAFDIDEMSIKITKLNMAIKYSINDEKLLNEHIYVNNYLLCDEYDKYNYILGNPPWGYSFTNEEKDEYKKLFKSASGKSIESYDMFIEKSFKAVKNYGKIAFVLPEAILNVKSHTNIRKIIVDNSNIESITYLGNIFDGVLCPSIIMKIKRTDSKINTKGTIVSTNEGSFVINSSREIDENSFDFLQNDEVKTIIDKVNSCDVVYLKDKSDFALGIVTGNNDKYLSNIQTNDSEIVLKGKNIYKFKIIKENCYISFDPSKFQQVAPIKFYRAKEKLLYRFICDNLVFAYDNDETLTLNSCNILIPKIEDMDNIYILGILNSNLLQFYYDVCFNSVKKLRSHIESLPIFNANKSTQNKIKNIVKNIMKCENDKVDAYYNELNKEVYKIYKISSEQKTIIEKKCKLKNRFIYTN